MSVGSPEGALLGCPVGILVVGDSVGGREGSAEGGLVGDDVGLDGAAVGANVTARTDLSSWMFRMDPLITEAPLKYTEYSPNVGGIIHRNESKKTVNPVMAYHTIYRIGKQIQMCAL